MRRDSREFWEGVGPGNLLLWPLSVLYACGWQAYATVYRFGLKRPKEPHRPVIVVGNLRVGGTGKTPVVVYVGSVLMAMGHEVVVSASGYGSPASEGATLAPPGRLNAADWGDEPAVLRECMPNVQLVVGRDRVAAARLVHERFPTAVLLLDDGLQHLPLQTHVKIVLDDPEAPNRMCMPAGPYREPSSGLSRADLVLPGRFRTVPLPLRFVDANGAEVDPKPGTEVDALCAIARPARFHDSLRHSGVQTTVLVARPDHDPLTRSSLLGDLGRSRPLVVTLKDWVKLCERPDLDGRIIWIARHEVRVEPESEFREWLCEQLKSIAPEAR